MRTKILNIKGPYSPNIFPTNISAQPGLHNSYTNHCLRHPSSLISLHSFNMTSSSHNPKTQAQVATTPDSPHQKTPSSEEKIQRHIKAIHDLLADKKSHISWTRQPHSNNSIADKLEQISKAIEAIAKTQKVQPLDDGSEFLTENRLADSIEVA